MKRVNSGDPGQSDSHCVQAFPTPKPPGHNVHSLSGLLWPHWEDGALALNPSPVHRLVLHRENGQMLTLNWALSAGL